MGEGKPKTLEEVFAASDDAESVQDIVNHLDSRSRADHLSESAKADAKKIKDALVAKLATAPESDHLAIARAARKSFRRALDERTKAYVSHCIETEWEPWRALFHYQRHPEDRPADSKYSLEEIANYREEPKEPKGTAPKVEELEEI